eukprot:Clim_evm2s34 gene=Clim_evmTU2s34
MDINFTKTTNLIASLTLAAHAATAGPVQATPLPGECRSTWGVCDVSSIMNPHEGDREWDLLRLALCDTTPIAQDFAENKDDLENYIADLQGRYMDGTEDVDAESAWVGVLKKMNGLVGPILQAPFYDESASSEAVAAYKTQLNAVMGGTSVDACATGSQADDVPLAVSFPIDGDYNLSKDRKGTEPDHAAVTWWNVEYREKPEYVEHEISTHNGLKPCATDHYSYKRDVQVSSSATSERAISNSFTINSSVTMSATAKAEFAGMGAEYSEEVEFGFEDTTEASITSSTTKTESTSQEVASDYEVRVPEGAIVNVTHYINQIEATLSYTNDVYYKDSTLVDVYLSTSVYHYVGASYPKPPTATFKDLKNLVYLAGETMGVTFDSVFVDSLFVASVQGTAVSTQGMSIRTITNACQASEVSTCDEQDAMAHPAEHTCSDGIYFSESGQ